MALLRSSPGKSTLANDANSTTDWTKIISATRTGFETMIDISSESSKFGTYVRGRALNATGGQLGWTDATDGGTKFFTLGDESSASSSSSTASGTASPASPSTDGRLLVFLA